MIEIQNIALKDGKVHSCQQQSILRSEIANIYIKTMKSKEMEALFNVSTRQKILKIFVVLK